MRLRFLAGPTREVLLIALLAAGFCLPAPRRQGVLCDLLVISGHFDDGSEFYSDRLGVRESLAVAEMERVSCSDSCPGLFSQLKEVYLFGCNTLNADAVNSTTPEVGRSLVRAGDTAAAAGRPA